MAFYFLSETELAFFVAMEGKIALPPFWGTFEGNGGPGKIISPVAGSAGACTTRFFLLDHRTTCTVFPVFAMFAMTTMADSCTLPVCQYIFYKDGQIRPVEHIFHCLSNI